MAPRTRVRDARPAPTTKQALIRHGSQLMRRGGYTDCGLVELLDSAGLPRGSFYHHFGSKEGFAVETIRAFYAWHDALLEDLAADRSRPALERLRSYFETLLDRAERASPEERGCLLAVLTLEKSATSPAIREALQQSFARWQERVGNLLREARARGELETTEEPDRLAAFLLHAWEGALLRARLEREVWPLTDFLEYALPRLLLLRP